MHVTRQAASIVLQSADDLVLKFIDEGMAEHSIAYHGLSSVVCFLPLTPFFLNIFPHMLFNYHTLPS